VNTYITQVMDNNLFFLIAFVFLVWLSVVTYVLFRINSHHEKLTVVKNGNLKEVLEELLKSRNATADVLDKIGFRLDTIEKKELLQIRKVGVYKYNPFPDTGGNQSFILVILDGNSTGVILTSLHTRGVTRWFAKNIIGGKGVDFDLTAEEITAIKSVSGSAPNGKVEKYGKK